MNGKIPLKKEETKQNGEITASVLFEGMSDAEKKFTVARTT